MATLAALLGLFSAGIILFLSAREDFVYMVIREGGPVETAQFVGYLVGAVLAGYYGIRKTWAHGLSGGAILLVFALREMDLQTRFTGMSVIKTKFFITQEFSLLARLTAALVLVAIVVFIAVFAKRTSATFLKGLKQRKDWAISAAAGIVMLPLSLVFDGAKRYAQALGVTLSGSQSLLFAVLEETTELAIPVMFLAALLQWNRGRTAGNH